MPPHILSIIYYIGQTHSWDLANQRYRAANHTIIKYPDITSAAAYYRNNKIYLSCPLFVNAKILLLEIRIQKISADAKTNVHYIKSHILIHNVSEAADRMSRFLREYIIIIYLIIYRTDRYVREILFTCLLYKKNISIPIDAIKTTHSYFLNVCYLL